MLKFIDHILLTKTQEVCDRFTILTGHTKFRLEVWAIVVSTALYWVFAIKSMSIIIFTMAVIITISNIFAVYVTENIEKEFLKNNKLLCGRYNNCEWLRYLMLIMLTFAFILSIIVSFSLLSVLLMLWSAAFTADMYISACTPVPSGKSQIKKWLVNVMMRIKPLPVPINDSW